MKNKKKANIVNFLKGGLVTIGLFIVYEIITFMLIDYFGLLSLALSWGPFIPMSILFNNIWLIFLLTIVIIFSIGGVITILLLFILNKFKGKKK